MSDPDQTMPRQHQDEQPGHEGEMHPEPRYIDPHYRGSGKLLGKVALITGADSGIGRAVAVYFAMEGANVAMVYLNEHDDARHAYDEVLGVGGEAVLYAGDVGDQAFCQEVIERTLSEWGRLDILVNNAGEQHPTGRLEDIPPEQWEQTFRTNLFSIFLLTQAALPHLPDGGAIINTTSITAYKGNPVLLDYSASKGAIVSFTRSLAMNLSERGIRVNAVAPGPIWTPLIPSTFDEGSVAHFGGDTPMGRPGQPSELAPAYVYLASQDASYVSGQVLHVNGGVVLNG